MASQQSPFHIAIIGAGLSGLSLAVALSQIPSSTSPTHPPLTFTIYESRPSPTSSSSSSAATTNEPLAPSQLDIGGALMLSPNGLRVLDSMSIYPRIKNQGHNFRTLFFQDAVSGAIKETYSFGHSAKYGYDALRLYRRILVAELLKFLSEKGVEVQWGRKFSHVVSEDLLGGTEGREKGKGNGNGKVTFAFADGTEESATLLVGADGIHSRVRRHMYPDLVPKFTGMAGLTAAVPTANLGLDLSSHGSDDDGNPNKGLEWPYALEDPSLPHPLPLTLIHLTFGGFVIAPQAANGSEVLIGRQIRLEEDPGYEGLKGLMSDKKGLIERLRLGTDIEGLPAIVRNAVKDIPEEGMNLWPFYVVPRLERWSSQGKDEGPGRVLILGDAAHAVPPSAGQGVNQALEDVWGFKMVVEKVVQGVASVEGEGKSAKRVDMADALGKWQEWRQGRVDRVLELNAMVDRRRMPALKGESEEGKEEKGGLEVDWLYGVDFEEVVKGWFS